MKLNVSDPAFEYLAVQVGSISELRHMRPTWELEYHRVLRTRFAEILPHLPRKCSSILDVGSGLGGIDVLLYHHYNHPRITLMDGGLEPTMVKHDEPFCNGQVALDFQRANHVQNVQYVDVEDLRDLPKQDLILSFQAWCFHIRPDVYMDYVVRHCHETTVLILDVRRNWVSLVLEYFDGIKIAEGQKFERWRLLLK